MKVTPIDKVKVEKLARRQGGVLLRVSMWHERPEVLTLSVTGYYPAGFKGRNDPILLARETFPLVQGGITKPELAQTVKNMALMVAMQLGEPDAHIVSNDPFVMREALIKVQAKAERTRDSKQKLKR